MKRHQFILMGVMVLLLLLSACGSGTTQAPARPANPTQSTLGDNTVRSITIATQSGDFHTSLDSTPDIDGTTIYFTASSSHSAGVFRVPASGGPVTSVFVGSPFVTPRGIAISPDGKQLYVTDGAAGDKGEIFSTAGYWWITLTSAGKHGDDATESGRCTAERSAADLFYREGPAERSGKRVHTPCNRRECPRRPGQRSAPGRSRWNRCNAVRNHLCVKPVGCGPASRQSVQDRWE